MTARKRVEEELAEQRRRELDRLAELEKFQKLTVGRELKMVELKKEIEELKRECEQLKRKSPCKERDDASTASPNRLPNRGTCASVFSRSKRRSRRP